jgi:hypothetical protein
MKATRLIALVLGALCTVLGLTANATAAPVSAPARAAAGQIGQYQALTFTSVSNGRALDVQNGNNFDGVYIVTNSAPGYHEAWHLNVDPSDYSFTIVNNDTGKCVDVSWPALRQETCAGQASQKWYFEPVAGTGQAFMIRHVSDNACLDLMAGAQYNDAWTDSSGCNGNVNQQWTTGTSITDLALGHGAAQCQKDTSSCSWAETSEAPAAPLPTVCASSVWYNNTSGPIGQAFSVDNTTGWSDSVSSTINSGLGSGGLSQMAVQVSVGMSVNVTAIWQGSKTVNNSVSVTVPAKQYGWVTLSELAKKVTGNWTFDAQGFPWTATDTVVVPLASDPSGGATLYVANTAPTFTSCS